MSNLNTKPPQSPAGSPQRMRSKTPPSIRQASSKSDRSASRQRSRSPSRYSRSPSRPISRTGLTDHTPRNGDRGRARTRSHSRGHSRSRTPSRGDQARYREKTYSRSPSRDRIQSSKIVVEKLTKNVTEAHLREIFGTYGKIESIDLPLNRQFMTNRGTAYIIYDHPSASESAIAHMHEAQLDGVVITVSIVLPRRAFSRSPPPAKSERRFAGPGRGGPPPRDMPSRSFRNSPPLRRGGFAGGRRDEYGGPDRNGRRGRSRSASPVRRRRRSYSDSRSPSRSPPRRRGPAARSPPRRRRRSRSYSSHSSYSRSKSRTRSPSRSRSPSRTRSRYGGRR